MFFGKFLEIIFYYAKNYPLSQSHPVEVGIVIGGIIVILTVPLAYLSQRFVEKPFITLSRYLTEPRHKEFPVSLVTADIKVPETTEQTDRWTLEELLAKDLLVSSSTIDSEK